MTEVRFHRDLYSEAAVQEAVARYRPYAEIACAEHPADWCVTVATAKAEREQRIAHELANYALGLTIRARKQ